MPKTLAEIAQYAVEVIEDLMDYVSPAYEQHYQEELAYLRQALKEAKDNDDL